MNTQKIIFVGIGIIITALIAITYFGTGIGVKMLIHAQEANQQHINENEQMVGEIERMREIAKRVVLEDEQVQELINNKLFSGPILIFSDDVSHADAFLKVGGEYRKTKIMTEGCEGEKIRLVGGKIYKIPVDLNNETVGYIEEEINQTLINIIDGDDAYVKRCFTHTEKI